MRLTFLEQSRVPVGRSADAAVGSLGAEDAASLVDLGEGMGARIASWLGARAVHIHQFVGAVRMGDLHVEILPKIDGLDGPDAIRRSLLAMLAKAQDLEVRDSEAAGFLESAEPFICVLARLYCRRLFEAVRFGLRQEYVAHDEVLPILRGKVHWPSQASRESAQRLEFRCLFDERSADTPLNRTLKAALLAAERMLEGAADSSAATELRHLFADVPDACPPREVVARLRTDRMSRRLAPLLALAKLLLGNRSPDLGRATTDDRRSYAVVWDMNLLFEEYVGRVCQDVFEPKGLDVDLQGEGSVHLAEEASTRRRTFLLKPDVLLRKGRSPRVVADTKWKRLDPQTGDLGVSGEDVYQVLAYAHRYATESAVLIYPHHPAVGRPGLQRDFVIQGGGAPRVVVRVMTVDLARLESVPGQVGEAVGAGRTSEPASSTGLLLKPAPAFIG